MGPGQVAVLRDGAQPANHPVRPRPGDVVAVGHLTLPVRRPQQVGAAAAGVRSGQAPVHQPPLVQIESYAQQRPGCHLDDDRPVVQVEDHRSVRSVGVQGQAGLVRALSMAPKTRLGTVPAARLP